jgi:hypothetical protein|tara:strand:- start:8 stop:232 length:225 start_codon:yes stop_codon:yes gene_type:complete
MSDFSENLQDQILRREVFNELKQLEMLGIPINERIYQGLKVMSNDPLWIDLSEYDNMKNSEIADLLIELYNWVI